MTLRRSDLPFPPAVIFRRGLDQQHAELHKSIRTEPFMAGRKEAKPNRRAKARDHTRIDFTKPCEMPGSGSTATSTSALAISRAVFL